MVQIRTVFERFVTRLQTDFVPRFVCKTANGFRTRCNYSYIWPMTLLVLKYMMTSARNAAAIFKGMVWPISLLELKYMITSARNAAAIAKGIHSILLERREKAGGKVRGA